MDELQVSCSFTIPPEQYRDQIVNLLTIGKIWIEGVWSGKLGEYFVGWAPLDKPKQKQTNGNKYHAPD